MDLYDSSADYIWCSMGNTCDRIHIKKSCVDTQLFFILAINIAYYLTIIAHNIHKNDHRGYEVSFILVVPIDIKYILYGL